jgi:hypothetical protein
VPIEGAEALIAAHGSWPSFHDAEILSASFDLNNSAVRLRIGIRVDEPPQPLEEGLIVGGYSGFITLLFEQVEDGQFDSFWRQNVLFELLIDESEPATEGAKFHVTLDPSVGFGGEFDCAVVKVEWLETTAAPG